MIIAGRPSRYEHLTSNAPIAVTDSPDGVEMRIEPQRDEADFKHTSIWLTVDGKLTRGMEKGQSYTIDVELTPVEVARAFVALPPQVIPEALAKAIVASQSKAKSIQEYREIVDRHSEGLVNKSDLVSTLHAMLDALSALSEIDDNNSTVNCNS